MLVESGGSIVRLKVEDMGIHVYEKPLLFRVPLINYLRCYCCVKNQLKMRIYDL